jgi:hypothetical protein
MREETRNDSACQTRPGVVSTMRCGRSLTTYYFVWGPPDHRVIRVLFPERPPNRPFGWWPRREGQPRPR